MQAGEWGRRCSQSQSLRSNSIANLCTGTCGVYSWLIALCTFGYAQSFGVYEDLYTLSGASTPSNVAWIGSFQLFMMFAMGLPAGKLFDAGYFRHLEIGGALIFVFSYVPFR